MRLDVFELRDISHELDFRNRSVPLNFTLSDPDPTCVRCTLPPDAEAHQPTAHPSLWHPFIHGPLLDGSAWAGSGLTPA